MTRILIVEDNEMNLDMLSRRLAKKGYEILSARDGQAGIDMCRQKQPDVVLMDMSLPVVDGWTATRMLKSEADTSAVPIIALTAHAMEADRNKALNAGCDAFATKPIDLPALIKTIEDLLSG